MRILVAGTGFTGSRILGALAAAGHHVLGLNRSGVLPSSPDIHIVRGDVLNRDSLRPLASLPPVDLLISTLSGTGQQDPALYRELYVEGPRRLMQALRWQGEPRIWMLGSTGVYGVSDGSWVDEHTPAEPLHRNGEVQLAAEQALFAACDQSCVFRLSGLYGPGRTRLIRQALRQRPFFKPDLWANQIHADDVAGLLTFLAGSKLSLPRVLLVSDQAPALRKDIFSWIREEINLPDGVYDEDHPHGSGMDRGNKRVNSARMQGLGYRLKYPDFREGLKPLLAEG